MSTRATLILTGNPEHESWPDSHARARRIAAAMADAAGVELAPHTWIAHTFAPPGGGYPTWVDVDGMTSNVADRIDAQIYAHVKQHGGVGGVLLNMEAGSMRLPVADHEIGERVTRLDGTESHTPTTVDMVRRVRWMILPVDTAWFGLARIGGASAPLEPHQVRAWALAHWGTGCSHACIAAHIAVDQDQTRRFATHLSTITRIMGRDDVLWLDPKCVLVCVGGRLGGVNEIVSREVYAGALRTIADHGCTGGIWLRGEPGPDGQTARDLVELARFWGVE